jgi:hypothetical protein
VCEKDWKSGAFDEDQKVVLKALPALWEGLSGDVYPAFFQNPVYSLDFSVAFLSRVRRMPAVRLWEFASKLIRAFPKNAIVVPASPEVQMSSEKVATTNVHIARLVEHLSRMEHAPGSECRIWETLSPIVAGEFLPYAQFLPKPQPGSE